MERAMSKTFVAKSIYGLITVLVVLLTMTEHPPTALRGALTLFGATLAVALVDAYSDTISVILSGQHPINREELREIWRSARPVLVGAQAPTVVFFLSAAGLFSVEKAINIAIVVVFILLFSYGLRVGQQLHKSWLAQVLSGLALLAISAILVGIKLLFH